MKKDALRLQFNRRLYSDFAATINFTKYRLNVTLQTVDQREETLNQLKISKPSIQNKII